MILTKNPSMKQMLKELINILVSKSLQVAPEPIFKLASGTKSNTYIDCKKTTLTAKGSYLIGTIFFDRISHLNVDAIGGLTLGADPIALAVSQISYNKNHPINAFIVRKEPKGHGLKQEIEGDVRQGDNVIIVDDVITTGGSTIKAIQRAREFGLNIIKVIVLVDRQEGGKENILDQNVDLEAIMTKQDLLDEYYRRTKGIDKQGALSR
ncbi:MAG TPA: orotate phosphoribosyltransferase [Thermodesulfovibrionales bacterium]|nr:orotate phosphoribosyltransferase [Thermodesulfovibrionales bacterium]